MEILAIPMREIVTATAKRVQSNWVKRRLSIILQVMGYRCKVKGVRCRVLGERSFLKP